MPKVGGLEGIAYKIFDGAMLFERASNSQKELFRLPDSEKIITAVFYSYPKGVEAEKKKTIVAADDHEICVFLEIQQDDKIDISIKSGNNFRIFLNDFITANKLSNSISSIQSMVYKSDIQTLEESFAGSVTHLKLFDFIGKTIGIELTPVNEELLLRVKINKIRARTSEPYDNAQRKIKVKKRKFIVVDFEILNQPAVNYNFIVFKGKEEIYNEVTFPSVTIKAEGNAQKNSDSDELEWHQPGHYQILWDCTDNGIFESKNLIERLSAKVEVTGVDEQRAFARMEFLLKETVENAEQDNSILVNDEEVFASEILERQKTIKEKIGQLNFEKLSKEEQLIIDLPIILVKLGWLYGAYCQIHWLEGTGFEIIIPYEFPISYKRSKEAYAKMLKNIEKAEFATFIDKTNYSPTFSIDDDSPRFLYDISLDNVLVAYNKAVSLLLEIVDLAKYDFGNFDFSEAPPKMNFILALASVPKATCESLCKVCNFALNREYESCLQVS